MCPSPGVVLEGNCSVCLSLSLALMLGKRELGLRLCHEYWEVTAVSLIRTSVKGLLFPRLSVALVLRTLYCVCVFSILFCILVSSSSCEI